MANSYDAHIKVMDGKIALVTEKAKNRLMKTMFTLLDGIKEKNGLDVENIAILNAMSEQLSQVLYAEDYAQVAEVYREELEFIKKEFESRVGTKMVFSDFDKESMQAMLNADFDKLDSYMRNLGIDVKATVIKSLYVGEQLNRSELVDKFGSRTASYIETNVKTGASAFTQSIELNQAEELYGDDPYFIYVGPSENTPLGNSIRDFCRDHLDKIYSLKEIKAMDNGQGLPVLEYKGGYNCRHHWATIPTDDALEQLGRA